MTSMLTVKQAAAWLGIPVKSLYQLTAGRRIAFTRLPGTKHIRFNQEHLDAYVAAGEQPVIEAHTRFRVVDGNATGPRPPAGPKPKPKPKPKARTLDRIGRAS